MNEEEVERVDTGHKNRRGRNDYCLKKMKNIHSTSERTALLQHGHAHACYCWLQHKAPAQMLSKTEKQENSDLVMTAVKN